jgi:hypothetical protein
MLTQGSSALRVPVTATEIKLLRVGAILAVMAAIFTWISGELHPSREQPDDHVNVFMEYARSDVWVIGHLIQTFSFFLMFAALIALAYVLIERGGWVQVLARMALPIAVAAFAVAAVMQGLDTVALKAVTVRWADAQPSDKSATFAAAEAVRFLEIGFNSMFRMLQGVCIVLVGAAIATGGGWVRWLGWSGVGKQSALVAERSRSLVPMIRRALT